MHTPSPESTADLMTWVNAACDLGHTSIQAIKNPALQQGEHEVESVITTQRLAADQITTCASDACQCNALMA